MTEFKEGDVVILVSTGQAGTIFYLDAKSAWVLLTCGNIWIGSKREIRIPQDQSDLDACPINP